LKQVTKLSLVATGRHNALLCRVHTSPEPPFARTGRRRFTHHAVTTMSSAAAAADTTHHGRLLALSAALASLSAALAGCLLWERQQRQRQQHTAPPIDSDGVLGAIGNTRLICIASLSAATGCQVGACAVVAAADSGAWLTLWRATSVACVCAWHQRTRAAASPPPMPHTAHCSSTTAIHRHPTPHPPQKILGKAEFLNPGGSVKDRVALRIVQEALVGCAGLVWQAERCAWWCGRK
jgi:hypothetical protein